MSACVLILTQVASLQSSIDALYRSAFEGVEVEAQEATELNEAIDLEKFPDLSEAAFGELGRTRPKVISPHSFLPETGFSIS